MGGEVVGMVSLGRPELYGGGDLGDDGVIEDPAGRQFGEEGAGLGFLFRRVIEDGRPVLRAGVVALPVEGGGVVYGEEDLEDIAI